LSFGYAITRHRLTDVKVIFRQGAAYVMANLTLDGSRHLTLCSFQDGRN